MDMTGSSLTLALRPVPDPELTGRHPYGAMEVRLERQLLLPASSMALTA